MSGNARRLRWAAAAAGAVLAVGTVGAMGMGSGWPQGRAGAAARIDDPATTSPVSGDVLDPPISLPAATLTGPDGRPFDVRARTAGKVVVLFFGFTHCKDVCPTTMADITIAVHRLPAALRSQVSVLLVTADPWRDTPARLRSWVGGFDPAFIGLTGDYARIQALGRACGVFLSAPADRSGDYEVDHGSQTLIFSRDHTAHELFTADPDTAALARDLTRILSEHQTAPEAGGS